MTGLTTTATGGVAMASQERGGGGEAIVENRLQRTCSAGAGGRSSTAMLPRNWSRGSDLAKEGAAGGQQRRRDPSPRKQAAEQDSTALTWSWNKKDEGIGESGGGSGGGAACGPDGEHSKGGQGKAPLRQWGPDDSSVVGVGGEASAATIVREHPGNVTSGGRTERRGVRRRRNASLDDEVIDRTSSGGASRDEDDNFADCGVDGSDRLETGERCSKRIHSPNSACEEASHKSSDDEPPSIAREPDASISSGGGGGGISGGGGSVDPDDERRAAEVAAAVCSVPPVDVGISWFNTRSSEDVETDPYRVNWAVEASPSAAVASPGEEETFFAEHALEPKPRSGWDRESVAQGADASAGRAVAQGIVVRRLAQGIGVPRWGQHTDIYGAGRTAASASFPGGVADEAGRVSRPPAFHLERAKDAFPEGGGAAAAAPVPKVSAAAASVKAGAAMANEADTDPDAAADAHSTKFEWEVRPEAMAAYFTSVIGLVQPSVLPGASAERSPHSGTSVGSGQPAEVNKGHGMRGVVQAGAEPGLSVGDDSGTGGAGMQAESAAAASMSQSCSMSCVADPQIEGYSRRDGGGGDDEGSWGW